MAEQAEAGDVGRCLHRERSQEARGRAVEPEHPSDRRVEMRRLHGVVLVRGGNDAGAHRLGEIEHVAGPGAIFPQEAIGVRAPRDDEAVLRLFVHDRMTAGDDDAGLTGFVGAAAEYLPDDLVRQLAGEAGDGERQKWLAAHRVDVAQGVGGRNRPERVGVVNNGRKEVHRLNQRRVGAQAIDGAVVGGVETDQQIGGGRAFEWLQHVRQVLRTHFGRSPRAGSERRQLDCRIGHRTLSFLRGTGRE